MDRPIAYDKLAREDRFVRMRAREVAQVKVEQGLPPFPGLLSRESIKERVHGIMVGELQAMEGAGRTVYDFPDAPWEFTMDMARQVWDESRHVDIYIRLLEHLDGYIGEFPETTILWRCACAEDAAARAEKVYALELAMAKVSWPAADRRDEDKIYNPMSFGDLKKSAPGFDWDAMFKAADIPVTAPHGERKVIVAEKSAFPNLAKVFAATPIEVWRDYLTVRYLHTWASYLPKTVDDTDFAFYGTALNGKTAQLDRTIRGIHLVDGAMGEGLGRLYVAKYFPPEAKAKALILVQNLIKAYDADIRTLAWMTPPTRTKAIEKLHAMALKIGYPDKFRDYSALAVDRANLLGSVRNANLFEWHRQLRRIDGPVDRTEWGMTPPTNNAYDNFNFNEIVFPAGILQPPYFDPNADDAVNYGEIGATIGHEISHAFDDQGSKYNPRGILRNWFTPDDLKNFKARGDAIAAHYDKYQPLPGLHINGRLTLGENIADIAGLVIALKAYHISLGGKPAPILNGLTGDQRFYIAYAQSWRERHRDGAIRAQVLSNPHSPSEFRVNGVVRNTEGWYAAFDVKPGDKYYLPPDKRVPVW
jgi:predicted metalloendopeptidase